MKLEPLEAVVHLFSAHTSGERVLRGPQTAHKLGGVLPQKTKLYIGRYEQIQVLGQKTSAVSASSRQSSRLRVVVSSRVSPAVLAICSESSGNMKTSAGRPVPFCSAR